jgi:hypothetical protein
MGLSHLYGFG